MKIVKEFPPNIAQIRTYLNPDSKTVYAFGDKIYNPSGQELAADLEYHEFIHSQQQQNYSSPEIWWTKYLLDPAFRLQEEVEAYSRQYQFIKANTPEKYYSQCLEEFGGILSSPMYDLNISKDRAKTLIRRYEH